MLKCMEYKVHARRQHKISTIIKITQINIKISYKPNLLSGIVVVAKSIN